MNFRSVESYRRVFKRNTKLIARLEQWYVSFSFLSTHLSKINSSNQLVTNVTRVISKLALAKNMKR